MRVTPADQATADREAGGRPVRIAACSCGQLRLTCRGDPVRISLCHCLACQRRTGSVFAAQARYPDHQVLIEGTASEWTRRGDGGGLATFRLCPICGATLYWTHDGVPGFVAVAVGGFADPGFPPPQAAVYEERQHPWVRDIGGLPMRREF